MKNDFVCVCVSGWKNNHALLPVSPEKSKISSKCSWMRVKTQLTKWIEKKVSKTKSGLNFSLILGSNWWFILKCWSYLDFAVVFFMELHDIGKFYAGSATHVQFLLEQSWQRKLLTLLLTLSWQRRNYEIAW